jgi:hypothetical protein
MADILSRLAEIPIRIEPPAPPAGAAPCGGLGSGAVAALLTELASLLDRLAKTQHPAAIDLRSLPMSPEDRSELERVLGEGEVRATIQTQGELKAELLEVAQVPAILASASEEIAAAARALREHLSLGVSPGARRDR